jgi:hypothetical protein
MKMSEQEYNKRQDLCQSFITLALVGQLTDPVKAKNSLFARWGIRVDWHDMSDALCALSSFGKATQTGKFYDGIAEYIVN